MAATKKALALYDCVGRDENELNFQTGDVLLEGSPRL